MTAQMKHPVSEANMKRALRAIEKRLRAVFELAAELEPDAPDESVAHYLNDLMQHSTDAANCAESALIYLNPESWKAAER